MSNILKVTFIGIIGIIIAIQFKSTKQEYTILVGVGLSLVIFCFCLSSLEELFGRMKGIWDYVGDSGSYLSILLKVVGITYVCEFGQAISKDAGFMAVSEQIGIVGKLAILMSGLPIILNVLEQLQTIL